MATAPSGASTHACNAFAPHTHSLRATQHQSTIVPVRAARAYAHTRRWCLLLERSFNRCRRARTEARSPRQERRAWRESPTTFQSVRSSIGRRLTLTNTRNRVGMHRITSATCARARAHAGQRCQIQTSRTVVTLRHARARLRRRVRAHHSL